MPWFEVKFWTTEPRLRHRYVKRLRLAWRFKVMPWKITPNVVKYISLSRPSEADITRGKELAERFVWGEGGDRSA